MPTKRLKPSFLLVFFIVMFVLSMLPAGRALGSAQGAAPQQNETSYPIETSYPDQATPLPGQGYPNPEQPTGNATAPSEGIATQTLLPLSSQNPLTPSPTAGRNLFLTEDSEMGNSQVTPPPSETPQPSPTLTPSATPSVTPEFLQQFQLNRRLFTLGFVVPLGLLIAGWLGYRLLHSGEFKGN